jgi:serine/threonine protein kinase
VVVACSKVLSPAFALNEQRNITNFSGYFPGVFQKHCHSAELLSKKLMYTSKMREYRAHTRGKQETNSKFCSFFLQKYTYFFSRCIEFILLQAVDWWSVGVLTYELLTGASPFTVEGATNSQQEISR